MVKVQWQSNEIRCHKTEVGGQWREMLREFGAWSTVSNRFRQWHPPRGYRPRCRHQRVVVTNWSDDSSNTRTRRPPVGLTVSRTGCIPSLVMIRSEASLPT